MAQFGELLAELRQDRRLTQRELADLLFVSTGTISNYEKSVHFPDIEKLSWLADFFDVSTDYLLGRCSSRESLDVFKQVVVDGKTVGEFVQKLLLLPVERQQALMLIMKDMEFSTIINRYNKKEKT